MHEKFELRKRNPELDSLEKKILGEAIKALEIINVSKSEIRRKETATGLDMLSKLHPYLSFESKKKLRSICDTARSLVDGSRSRGADLEFFRNKKKAPAPSY